MSSTAASAAPSKEQGARGFSDLKLEVVVVPVADVDRSKAFYEGLGWRLDADFPFDNGFRVVQLTPPGSATSVQFGTKMTSAAPGSALSYLVVSDIEAAQADLVAHGAEVSDVFQPTSPGAQFGDGPDRESGRGDSYRTFATFSDPDGNRWLLQEVTTRLAGRIAGVETTYASAADLMNALIRAATAHGEHEKRNGGEYDEKWPEWYAAYMVAEQHGAELPQ
jgi:catechol 2,3-dioxygenase-like lactoylglutathione lyase family enzyme